MLARELDRGFVVGDRLVQFVTWAPIFKPKELTEGALALMSAIPSRYEDQQLDGTCGGLRTRKVGRVGERGPEKARAA